MKKCTLLCEHSDLGSCLRELTMCEVKTYYMYTTNIRHVMHKGTDCVFFRIGYRHTEIHLDQFRVAHIKLTYLTYLFEFYIDLLQLLWFRPFIHFFAVVVVVLLFSVVVVMLFRFYLVAKTSIFYFLLPVIWFFLSFQFSHIFFCFFFHIFIYT